MDTIEGAVLLAASHHAQLVPLSLILSPQTRGKGARLEHIQQSKDFLEAVQQKAQRHYVPLERFEAFTSDILRSIALLAPRLECDGMILALCGRSGSLLSARMIEQLLAISPCSLYLIYLPSKEPSWLSRLRERFSGRRPVYRPRVEKPALQPLSPGELSAPEMVLSRDAGSPDLEQDSTP
jgi:hypothetical protein